MNDKLQLKKKIEQLELQIKKLSLQANENEICVDLYNSLILQKAILNKQLADLDKNPLIENIKKIIPRRKKLICDYFN